MQIDSNGLEVLDRGACLRLLEESRLGRVGCTAGALPVVLPVNFRLVDDQIVFRTGVGTKLEAATDNAVVAFEVDHFDAMEHGGWSVLVTGFAREITNQLELARLVVDSIPRWVPEGGDRVVGVSIDLVSGRRIVHAG